MGDVTPFTGATRLDVPVERVIAEAAKEGFEAVLVVGMGRDGKPCVRSSRADAAEILWILKAAERKLMEACGL